MKEDFKIGLVTSFGLSVIGNDPNWCGEEPDWNLTQMHLPFFLLIILNDL
jgi:hypothetical protein